ncbi:heat shock protein 70 A1-like [Aphidius gifuensis]|uniref:heat shock protein 70 A1-like n=1 Tax=Aphidius gifuensis TaxID=684658 RepID=UPI001CDB66F4|nr:heat shock protein 70 A1-like [Aphidius gifuensis]
MTAIGIDLGTTNFCAAVWKDDMLKVIPNAQGKRTSSSYVGFTNTKHLIGDVAKNQAIMNPTNTLFNVKRLVGQSFDNPDIQQLIDKFPFKIVAVNNTLKIQVEFCGDKKEYHPEEIMAQYLAQVKESAELFLGETIDNAVLTVPASFSLSQRENMKIAGKIAGLNILRVISESTATALTYGMTKNVEGIKNVVVFDVGGGNTDVSVLLIEDGLLYEVLSTAGNRNLGGEDFNSILIKHLCEQFYIISGLDLTENVKALKKLEKAAINAKHNLSSDTETLVSVDNIVGDTDLEIKITRDIFEKLCNDLFQLTINCVKGALRDAKVEKESIDEILLVGGSTRIPKIRIMLQEFFNGKQLNFSVCSDETVAYGAAIQAAMLSEEKNKSPKLQGVQLTDVMPNNIGVFFHETHMYNFIHKNDTIPCQETREFTLRTYELFVLFKFYETDNELFNNKKIIKALKLSGVRVEWNKIRFNITLDVDIDGNIYVASKDIHSNSINYTKIIDTTGFGSSTEITQMITEAKKLRDYDLDQREAMKAKYDVESYLYTLKQSIDDENCDLDEIEKNKVTELCEQIKNFLTENSSAKKNKCLSVLNKAKIIYNNIVSKKIKEKKQAKGQLKNYLSLVEQTIEENDVINAELGDICDNTNEWLNANNKSAKINDYNETLEKIKQSCYTVMTEEQREKVKVKNELESLLLSIKLEVQDENSILDDDQKKKLSKAYSTFEEWLESGPDVTEYYKSQLNDLTNYYNDEMKKSRHAKTAGCSDAKKKKLKL